MNTSAASTKSRKQTGIRRMIIKLSRKLSITLTWRPRARVSRLLAMLLAAASAPALALPTAGTVGYGTVSESRTDSTLTVTLDSNKGIIEREGYSVYTGESVVYKMDPSATILERVTGSNPSEIFGSITASGHFFLINPNGTYFGRDAQVNVGSLVTSSLDISNADFIAGRYTFQNGGNAGSVVNQGSLSGKYIALVAPTVDNSGSINANGGTVALAAGDRVSLDISGDGLMQVSVDAAAAGARINHSGAIVADGGKVYITAKSADALMDTVLNVSGLVRAQSLNEQGGVIRLDGGNAGVVSVSGTLDASGNGGKGGTVTVLGDKVGLFEGAHIDASGNAGGGTVLVGGNYQGNGPEQNASMTYVASGASIDASATGNGNGGKVVVWSNEATRYYGSIAARGGAAGGDGGAVEVSGKQNLTYAGSANVGAANGQVGTVLLDPNDLYVGVAQGGATEDMADPFQAMDGNDYYVLAASLAGDAAYTLQANHDVIFNADVAFGSAGANGVTVTATNNIQSTGFSISTAGGALSLNSATMSLGAINTGAGLLTINNSGAATQSGVFAGSGGLTKTGAGTLTLSQTNTYTGTTTISAGTLALGSSGVVADAGSISVNGGTLDIGANNETVTGVTLVSGSITGTTGILTANTYAVESGSISAKLGDRTAGTSTLTKTTGGTVTLSGDNAYEGLTTVSAGTLTVGHANGLGTTDTGTTVASGAILNINGVAVGAEALNVQGSGVSAGAITGTGSLAGAITLAGDTTVGVASGTLTLSGAINDGGSTFGLTKLGAGELVLSGGNGYDGLTTVSVGTLTATSDSALGGKIGVGSGTSVASGAKLVLQDADVGLEAIDVAGGTLAMTGTATATGVTFSAGSSTLDYAGYTGAVAVNQNGGTATGITAITNFGNIGTLVGSGTNTTLTGANGGETFNISGANSGTAGSLAFSGVGNLTGGSGDDSFIFTDAGSLSGNVAGGGQTAADTLDLSAKIGAVAIGQAGTATGINGTFSGIEAVVGNGTDTTLTAANGGQTFNITGANSGTAGSLAFSGISSLTGGNGSDSFVFADLGSLSGSVAGGAGTTDTLDLHLKSGAVAINQATGAATGLDGSFSGIEAVVGNGVNTTLTGTATAQTFTITGADDGTAGTLAFTDVGNLTGGAGDDSFVLSGGSLTGAVNGGGGNNSLTGGNVANTWTVTAANTGTVNGVTGGFSSIQNLTGGTDNDSFTINDAGSLSGNVDGGTGTTDTLDLHLKSGAVAINQETGAATDITGGFSGIEAVVGNGVNTTLTGTAAGETFTITGADDGTAGTLAFTDVGNLTGGAGDDSFVLSGGSLSGAVNGGGGNNSLTGGNVANTWTVTVANTGTVTGVTGGFSDIQNLIGGTDNDSFTINAAGSLSGDVDGGTGTTDTLDLHLKSGAVAINQETGAATDITGGFSGIEAVVGNGVNTTLTGTAAGETFTITGADDGTAGTLAFTDVGNLTGGAGDDSFVLSGGSLSGAIDGGGGDNSLTGGNVANTWTVTALDTGTVTGVTGGFSDIQNLIGGTDNDSFTINAAGSLSGDVDGGTGTTDTLDLHLKSGAVAINQETGAATGLGGSFSGIEAVVGNGVDTTITGADAGQTFTITGADAGAAGSLAFTGVGNLTGGSGADVFTGTSGSLSGNIVDASGVTTLGGTLQTTGSQSYTGAVLLATDTTITAGSDVTFGSAVNGNVADGAYARSLSVTSSAGDVSFGGAVGGITALNSLTIDTSGAMALPVINAAALSVTADGAITDSTTMTVTGLASFDGTSITLDGTNNFGTLTFNSAGDVNITEAGDMNIVGANTAKNLALTSTSGSIDAYYPSNSGTPARIWTTETATFTATSAGAHVYSGSALDDKYGGQVKVIADGYIWLYTSGDIELGEISSLSGSSVVVQATGDITNNLGGASINAPYDGVSKFGYVYLYSANGGIGASAVSGVVKDPSKGIYFTPETKQIIMSLNTPTAQAAATFDLDTQVVEMGDTQPFSAVNGQIYFQTTAAPNPGDTPAPTGATQGNQLFLCSLQSVSCTDAFTGDVFYAFDIGGILNAAAQDLFNSTFGTDNIRVAIQNGFLTEFGVVPPGIDAIDGDGVKVPGTSLALVNDPPAFLIDEEEIKRRGAPK